MSLWKLEQVMREEIAEACKPIVAAIEAKYAPLIAEAKVAEEMRRKIEDDKILREALRDALWPVGTKLVEWTNRHNAHLWSRTGRVGFYEIFDERTSPPVTPREWHGNTFVRLAKKDGTPGRKSSSRWRVNWLEWLPEGEHPDTYKHPAKEREA
jgi:hypothetical protein